MIKLRPSQIHYIYLDKEYKLGKYAHGDTPYTYYHFISLDKNKYPDEILLIRDISAAYRTTIKVTFKGHELILKEIIGNNLRVWTRMGNPSIEILQAYPINDGGWYEAFIPKKDTSAIWEERYWVDGFKLPENLSFKEEIDMQSIDNDY